MGVELLATLLIGEIHLLYHQILDDKVRVSFLAMSPGIRQMILYGRLETTTAYLLPLAARTKVLGPHHRTMARELQVWCQVDVGLVLFEQGAGTSVAPAAPVAREDGAAAVLTSSTDSILNWVQSPWGDT